jgi:hypothetical protein
MFFNLGMINLKLLSFHLCFCIFFFISFRRQDPISFKSSGVKLLLYKDCKKNIRRVVKLRGEKTDSLLKNLQPNRERNSCDENNAQWVKDNQNTMEVSLIDNF